MTGAAHPGTVLIYSIHRTDDWFRHLGRSMGFENSITVSDIRDEGDLSLRPDFYAAYRRFRRSGATGSDYLDEAEVEDVITRCRVLKWLPTPKATAMALAMAEAAENLLDRVNPVVILSFPIDRYIKDILGRRAAVRGIPYWEYTASPLPEMSILLEKGTLLKRDVEIAPEELEKSRSELADPMFRPDYVRHANLFGARKFLKRFGYSKLRSRFFQFRAWRERDPLNLHYLDARSFLGHKPRLSDIRIMGMVDWDWRERIADFPKARRFALPLQLFPEASIDYWVKDRGLIDYEAMILEAASTFSEAGYAILVKDHPLQFGFRQTGFIERLKRVPNLVVLPYGVTGNELLAEASVSFALTGTLGLQAAMYGLKSITAPNYYTVEGDFIVVTRRGDIAGLPQAVAEFAEVDDLEARQTRIVENLLKGSYHGDYHSNKNFDPENPAPGATFLGRSMGDHVAALLEQRRRTAPIDREAAC